jgi:hypothetical protein
MKQLKATFESNRDKCGKDRWAQVRRSDHNALYRREDLDGKIKAHEVFKIKVIKAGAPLPGGGVVEETYESYPGAQAFGKSAWYYGGEFGYVAALKRYKELEANSMHLDTDPNDPDSDEDEGDEGDAEVPNQVTPSGKRGRTAKVRAEVVYPATPQWTVKDLLALNPDWEQPTLSVYIRDKIEAGEIKLVGQVEKLPGQKGKSANIYIFGSRKPLP